MAVAHGIVRGQQDPQFTNHMFYKLGYNPGFAGNNDAINGMLLNRYQWTGMPGAPKTLLFSVDGEIKLFGLPGGAGFNIISDELGFEQNILANFNYAYKATLPFGVLGIGASAGLFSKGINGEWSIPEDALGIYVQPGSDPAIPQGEVSQIAFDAGLGIYLSGNDYYAGISVTHLNQPGIKFSDLAETYLKRHYYLTAGYNIRLTDPLFQLRPSFLLKSDLAGWQVDLSALLFYNDQMWGGVSYRLRDAIALLVGLELFTGLSVGYSFDLVTSAIGRYGYGSHEIFLGYAFDLDRNRTRKYKSIRFL